MATIQQLIDQLNEDTTEIANLYKALYRLTEAYNAHVAETGDAIGRLQLEVEKLKSALA